MKGDQGSGWTRDVPISVADAALLIIDVQNHICSRESSVYEGLSDSEFQNRHGAFFADFDSRVLPNLRALQNGFRRVSGEVIYSTIESLTLDGRDRSLDYKISGFNIACGSWSGEVVSEISPRENEIVFKKTSSSVFISTNIDYVLRNLQIRQLVIAGVFTDQCVESAIRDACDLGYLVTQVTDACAAQSALRHESAIRSVSGYCRQLSARGVIDEISVRDQRPWDI